mgnify:CR=1 FL=1
MYLSLHPLFVFYLRISTMENQRMVFPPRLYSIAFPFYDLTDNHAIAFQAWMHMLRKTACFPSR